MSNTPATRFKDVICPDCKSQYRLTWEDELLEVLGKILDKIMSKHLIFDNGSEIANLILATLSKFRSEDNGIEKAIQKAEGK